VPRKDTGKMPVAHGRLMDDRATESRLYPKRVPRETARAPLNYEFRGTCAAAGPRPVRRFGPTGRTKVAISLREMKSKNRNGSMR
jgi:hypothetical protein